MTMTLKTPSVGGQAVVEGVMMRAPDATSVAVRRPDGSIVVRVRSQASLSKRFPAFSRPGLRGVATLLETMADGISALNFSAVHAMPQDQAGGSDKPGAAMTTGAIVATLVVSMAFGFALFAALPHFLTWGIGMLTGSDALAGGRAAAFHLVDGFIKLCIFILYIWLVSFMKDMRRVFEYHGAEHQAIYAFESGVELSPAVLERHTTLHPRCGTAFLVTVIAVSIFVFAGVFPLLPELSSVRFVNQALYVAIKLPLILPVAAISYEIIRFAGKCRGSWFGKMVSGPGLLMQKITTRRPDSNQQEIAIVALRSALNPAWFGLSGETGERIVEFSGYQDFLESQNHMAHVATGPDDVSGG